MYNYNKQDNMFTKNYLRLGFSEQQVKNIIKAGNILRQAKSLPLNRKVMIHRQVQRIIGGGDYMACAKTYANK